VLWPASAAPRCTVTARLCTRSPLCRLLVFTALTCAKMPAPGAWVDTIEYNIKRRGHSELTTPGAGE